MRPALWLLAWIPALAYSADRLQGDFNLKTLHNHPDGKAETFELACPSDDKPMACATKRVEGGVEMEKGYLSGPVAWKLLQRFSGKLPRGDVRDGGEAHADLVGPALVWVVQAPGYTSAGGITAAELAGTDDPQIKKRIEALEFIESKLRRYFKKEKK